MMGCWRTGHGGHRPTIVSMAKLSRTVASVPRPPTRSKGIYNIIRLLKHNNIIRAHITLAISKKRRKIWYVYIFFITLPNH